MFMHVHVCMYIILLPPSTLAKVMTMKRLERAIGDQKQLAMVVIASQMPSAVR